MGCLHITQEDYLMKFQWLVLQVCSLMYFSTPRLMLVDLYAPRHLVGECLYAGKMILSVVS